MLGNNANSQVTDQQQGGPIQTSLLFREKIFNGNISPPQNNKTCLTFLSFHDTRLKGAI